MEAVMDIERVRRVIDRIDGEEPAADVLARMNANPDRFDEENSADTHAVEFRGTSELGDEHRRDLLWT